MYNLSMDKVSKTDEEYKKELSPELYRLAREKGTETPGTGEYAYSNDTGTYMCAVCGNQLFSSDTKFITNIPGLAGWPSFDEALPGAVEFKEDSTAGMNRTEVVCAQCGSHLGHVFEENVEAKTGKHYCINSACLNLEKK